MAKTRQQKEEAVAELTDKFSRAKSAVFTQVAGFTMSDADELRQTAKDEGLDIMVAKKTLMKIAADSAGITDLDPKALEGSVLVTIGYDDEVAPARVMAKFLKTREQMQFLAGVLEGKGVGADMVLSLSKLPSKDELRAKVVGSINAPVSGFVGVLNGNLRNLVGVLSAIGESKS
ncbi:50S ribosomal protein L10 [Patescibacteria group bacterium]|nr:50S ribosomal protein L10 [Patescibacteria group bacterium]MBU1906969.1 50S ribosomal protein L10 [Patescibacteria group bacterium]